MAKINVYNYCLKHSKNGKLVTLSGRLFQVCGAATAKFRLYRWSNAGQVERPGDGLIQSEGLVLVV